MTPWATGRARPTPGGTTSYTYDAANQLRTESTAGTTRSYTWDVHGNQLSDGRATYEYDGMNRLTGVTVAGQAVRYAYDGDGAMVARTQGGSTVRFYHDGMWVINEGDGVGAITAAMPRSGSDFLGRQVGSAPMAYFLHDAHGDVVGVVDGGGQFLAKYAYDAFGVLTGRSGSFDNPYLYAGEYYDYTTGQYYLRARFYTPAIGRFVSADTYRGEVQDPRTLHLYAYVLSNPLSYIDPTGHSPVCVASTCAEGSGGISNLVNRPKPYRSPSANFSSSSGGFRSLVNRYTSGFKSFFSPSKGFSSPSQGSSSSTPPASKASPKGMSNPVVKEQASGGRVAHKEIQAEDKAKDSALEIEVTLQSGRRPDEVRNAIRDANGKVTGGEPVEIKPDTASGESRGIRQINTYMDDLGSDLGHLKFYDPSSHDVVRTITIFRTQ